MCERENGRGAASFVHGDQHEAALRAELTFTRE
jgi:hypothetical protein